MVPNRLPARLANVLNRFGHNNKRHDFYVRIEHKYHTDRHLDTGD